MSTIAELSRKETRSIRRLQQCLVASIFTSGSFSVGLLILAVFFPSPIVFTFSAASLILMLLYVWTRRLAVRHQIEAAIVAVCLSLWSIAILSAFIVPAVFAIIAVTAVLPVFIGLPFVGKPTLLRIIVGSSLVSVIVSILSLRRQPFSLAFLPGWLVAAINVVCVPVTFGLIFLLVWHYRTRLHEILAATQAVNAAIQESEQRLATQVIQSRTLAQRAQLLNQLANLIRNSLELDTILETVVQEIRSLLQIDRCQFIWYRPQAEQPIWEVAKEAVEGDWPSFIGSHPLELSSPLVQKILNLEMVRVDDVSSLNDPILRESLITIDVASLLSLPIQTASGDIGVVACMHHSWLRPWSDGEVELLQAVVLQLAIALNQSELYNQTRSAAEQAQAQAAKLETALSELQRTQSQLIQSEKMSSLGQLVAGVAHEINNPINFISGNLSHAEAYVFDLLELVRLYQQALPDPPDEIKAQEQVIDLDFVASDLPKLLCSLQVGTNRIREIVKSLRTFSRVDEAGMKTVDIHAGLDSTLMVLQNRLKANPERPTIEVIKDYGCLPKVECFPGQLNQVFMNLLSNAVDALSQECQADPRMEDTNQTSRSSPWIRISTRVLEENRVSISIADNGPGMTEEVHSQMFNPFFTTKPVGQGTGLGLPICHSIVVERHKGELRCVSVPGQGTEFVIEISIRQSALS